MQNIITIFEQSESLHCKSVKLLCAPKNKDLIFGMLKPEQYFKVVPPKLGTVLEVQNRINGSEQDFIFKESNDVIQAIKLMSEYGGVFSHFIRKSSNYPWYIRRFSTIMPQKHTFSKNCLVLQKELRKNPLFSNIIEKKHLPSGSKSITFIVKTAIPFDYSQLWKQAKSYS